MSTHRPVKYTPQLGQLICNKIATTTLGLAKLCADESMPYHATILSWLRQPDKKDFLQNYLLACEAQANLLNDEIIAIADEITGAEDNATHVSRSRLRIDARKWKIDNLVPPIYTGKDAAGTTPADDHKKGLVVEWGGRVLRI